ncbi:uncharacterized protein LOC135185778 isoform X3 [Pogoniulus pusillus]|uniref:uncharacterized protein LOC135185778 isoform X3 n=1 Tax=Pogoniulus pusillus TaxID=488313 RepID=UPI0030B95EE9
MREEQMLRNIPHETQVAKEAGSGAKKETFFTCFSCASSSVCLLRCFCLFLWQRSVCFFGWRADHPYYRRLECLQPAVFAARQTPGEDRGHAAVAPIVTPCDLSSCPGCLPVLGAGSEYVVRSAWGVPSFAVLTVGTPRAMEWGAELLCPSPAADLHSASAPSPGRVGCFGTRPWSCLKCNCCLQLVQKWISCGCGGRNVSVHTLRGQVPGLQCCSNGLWWLQAAAAREPKTQRVEGLGAALGCLQGFGRPEQV